MRPVILFPGWFVEQGKGTTRQVCVLNPKARRDCLEHEPRMLTADDVKLTRFHLSHFIRVNEGLRRWRTSFDRSVGLTNT